MGLADFAERVAAAWRRRGRVVHGLVRSGSLDGTLVLLDPPPSARVIARWRRAHPEARVLAVGAPIAGAPTVRLRPLDDDASRQLARRAFERGTLVRTSPATDGELDDLLVAAEGAPAIIERLAQRAARLGIGRAVAIADGLLEEGDLGGSNEDDALTQLRTCDLATVADLAAIGAFASAARADEIDAALGRGEAVEVLAEAGWLRVSEDATPLYRASRFVARLAARLDPTARAEAEARLAAWGRQLAPRVTFLGCARSAESLRAHADTLARIAHGGVTMVRAEAIDALIAWGAASPRGDALHDHLAFACDTLSRAAGRVDAVRIGELALAVAESARLTGEGATAREALAMGRACDDPRIAARAIALDGRARFNAGALDEASALAARARKAARAAGDPECAAFALLVRAWVDRERGEVEAAREASRRAGVELDEALALADGSRKVTTSHARSSVPMGSTLASQARLNVALVELALGDPVAARAILEAELDRLASADAIGPALSFLCLSYELEGRYDDAEAAIVAALSLDAPPFFRALWSAYRGRVALASEDDELAERALTQGLSELTPLGAGPSIGTVRALRAIVRARVGAIEASHADLEAARDASRGAGRAREAIVELAAAISRHLVASRPVPGDPLRVDNDAFFVEVAASLARPRGENESIHLRTMDAAVRAVAAGVDARARAHERMIVGDGGASIRHRGQTISLASRAMLRRLVRALVAGHREGRAVPDADLIRAMWPRERMLPNVAKNRLRVAIAELRGLGLRDVVVRDGEGYRLAAEVESG